MLCNCLKCQYFKAFFIFNRQQQRHISDSQVNNRHSQALRNGILKDEKWAGVQVMIFNLNSRFCRKKNNSIDRRLEAMIVALITLTEWSGN